MGSSESTATGSDDAGHRPGLSRSVAAQPRSLARPAEIADFLQVPVKSLYQWRYEGKGPRAYRVGRHLRYRWEDVESWLATTGGRAD
jgi:predicted DNA-binding transcriptional regulator AlpA